MVTAPGTDIPLQDNAVDVVVASSVFEHDRLFWRTFANICRVTRPGGYVYINAPSNGPVHGYPIDCWRFYPDAGIALQQLTAGEPWSVRLVESFVAERQKDGWNDFVAVFRRDGGDSPQPAARLHEHTPCRNIYDATTGERRSVEPSPEDVRLLATSHAHAEAQAQQLATCHAHAEAQAQQLATCHAHAEAQAQQYALDTAAHDQRLAELELALAAAQATAEQRAGEIAYRNDQIAQLTTTNGYLKGALKTLSQEIDAFRSSWTGRFSGLWNAWSRRPSAGTLTNRH
ncbi:methyltransferase domain-containing protein [Reyranella sp. CPCC 100927]|nr:methyltransferase domain-containing protein [Reyranella sp. CPCC 100927]TWS96306.1 methyltransferase domain-containing protein [Reyranella sp. CPCC 100927]